MLKLIKHQVGLTHGLHGLHEVEPVCLRLPPFDMAKIAADQDLIIS